MRMPPMVIDEVVLLIDTYFKICATQDKALQQLYREELSASLRSLPFFPEFRGNPTFRNINGMTLLLMNIDNVVKKKWPSNKTSKKKLDVISRYQDDQELLGNVAQAIRYISISDFVSTFPIDMTCDFMGGTLLFGYHIHLETMNDMAVRIRKNSIELNTNKCSICQDDLSFTYSSKAASLMELHFAAPIEWYTSKISPATHQFILLCPNCHRFAHSDVSLFGDDQLRDAVKL
jgi:predicted HNH restriction endonuclease